MTERNIKIGCDPELFVFSKKAKKIVSAHNLLPGTKKNPFGVPCGAIQVDGVAAEFNINPANTAQQFCNHISIVRNALKDQLAIKGRLNQDEYELVAKPTVFFTKTYWASVPEEAKELGCEPDYNAYTLNANSKPDAKMLMRTGSGHVHISWGEEVININDPWFEKGAELVRHLDHHLYPQSKKWDSDNMRRKLYGMEGSFRPKTYGVEYRVLSNAWLDDYRLCSYIFNSVYAVTKHWLAGEKMDQYKIDPWGVA